ncbi:NUDIX domain-containing protein [Streptomyces lancefieldiae]|uniref:NUDIX domain-containing protein n=1 Tax=Streptomyces lancefieldiae TaxID=3075520 RepID=A0ABU3B5I5_9ACTN|nr:NUDIX domain-containing protein [Streptomyces sp. DSM 40712]MDT0616543.1 NUDIX domain-containing protein [Streptomyces sp. DSM 40712]
MTTTSAPDERPAVAMSDEAYGALRTSAALWAGTSVLITNRRGQVVVQRVSYRPTRLLPGGTPEPEDGGDPVATAVREAREEAAAELAGTRYLGYLSDPDGPCARVRYAASLKSLAAARADPATGRTYVRILATPEQALEFFDWGPSAAEEQVAAAHQARVLLGIPKASHQPVTELPNPTSW